MIEVFLLFILLSIISIILFFIYENDTFGIIGAVLLFSGLVVILCATIEQRKLSTTTDTLEDKIDNITIEITYKDGKVIQREVTLKK